MGFPIGVQSVVFAECSIDELLDRIATTGIETIELWDGHLPVDASPERRRSVLEDCHDAGVGVVGYGVIDVEHASEVPSILDAAADLEVEYVSVSYDPDDVAIREALVAGGEARDLVIGLHNYSTIHHDDTDTIFTDVDDVQRVLREHPSPALGVCIDLGHFLVMEQEPPAVIPALGEHAVAVHCKDTREDELEVAPGDGQLDLAFCVSLLEEYARDGTPLIVEYELPAERATETLQRTERRLRDAIVAR